MTMLTPFPQVPRWRTLLGSVALARNPILKVGELFPRYGDTMRLYLGGVKPAVLTRDPALIQHILQKNHRRYQKSDLTHGLIRYLGRGLLTNEGTDWLRQRRLIQPGFHRQRLTGLTRLLQDAAREWTTELAERTSATGAAEVDIHEAMTRVAFRIVARATFSTSMSAAEGERLAEVLTRIQAFYVRTLRQPYLRSWFRLTGAYQRHDAYSQELRELIRGYIRQRQQQFTDLAAPDDLLQMLLDARYEDTGEPMSEQQLLDEANILLVAGHETSANALSWLFYLLAHHPTVAEKTYAELAAVLAEKDTPDWRFEDLARLPYSLQVVQETMRLYPPAWIVDRVALEDDEFQGKRIPKGTSFSLYLYGLHHHPALWPETEAFRPERFVPGAEPPLPAYGYLPFGGGPRLCVGSHFALTEIQVVLLETLQQFTVELVSEVPADLQPLVTLRPRGALPLRFRRR